MPNRAAAGSLRLFMSTPGSEDRTEFVSPPRRVDGREIRVMLWPSHRRLRWFPILTGLMSVLADLHGQPVAAPPPAEVFFQPVSYYNPKLSPDGAKVCALTRFDDRHYALTVTDLASKKSEILAKSKDVSALNFWWKSDDLLLLLVEGDSGNRVFQSLDLRAGKMNELDGLRDFIELEFLNELPDDPEQMLFRSTSVNTTDHDLIKVNIRTGRETRIEEDPGGVSTWFTNHAGEAVAGWGYRDERWFLLWRSSLSAKWQRREFPKGKLPEIVPCGLAPDQRRLIIDDFRKHSTACTCYYDSATGVSEEVAPADEVETDGIQFWGNAHDPCAIVYETDRRRLHFLNAEAESVHQWLEKMLPGTERSYLSFSRNNSRVIVLAYNSRNPGVYCLLDLATKKLTVLAASNPAINPTAMSPSRDFKFTTGDGLNLSGRITLPSNLREPPPLILFVGPSFDGPRTRIAFDHIAQFFTSRGYATARINHRGTAGFGRDFSATGDFQIATGMVRDLTEGVQWLHAQGWVDQQRAAIFADAWGGLTALPLAVKSGLFRAFVNFNTPLDISRLVITDFSTSGRSKDDLIGAIGGPKLAEAYPKSINPLIAFTQLNIPSFHHYTRVHNPYGIEFDAEGLGDLRSLLKKGTPEYEISYSDSSTRMLESGRVPWKEQAQRFEAVVAFLKKHL